MIFLFGLLLQIIVLISSPDPIYSKTYNIVKPKLWWESAKLYQIWPNSFKDSDGDGIGDIKGITSKMNHFVDMGIDCIWLSPFYESPMIDSGYDISNYREIYPDYGTLEDFDDLISTARRYGIKVIIDYVPNHTSDQHQWFVKSKEKIDPYTDYYVWNEGKIDENGTRIPPNNWLSNFGGSAWKWVEERQEYYLHQFSAEQPDVNFLNPQFIKETKDILTFWLDRGIDGFRMDALPFLIESSSLEDEPLSGRSNFISTDYYYLEHIYTNDQPGTYDIVKIWRDHIDDYSEVKNDGVERVMFVEAYANITSVMKYYDYGTNVPFNFFFIKDNEGAENVELNTASDIVDKVHIWMDNLPENNVANWVFGNHDNNRLATKFGKKRVDIFNFFLYLLPGIATIYNGDELGMTDTYISWEDTQDPRACSTNPERYQFFSRDPVRTPYQWDNTTSAGFSVNATTRVPVNENYMTLNLAAQKEADISHYKNVQAAIRLRKNPVVREGDLDIQVINNQVVAFTRILYGHRTIIVLANWGEKTMTIDLKTLNGIPKTAKVLIADIYSGIKVGDIYKSSSIKLPGNAAVVLEGVEDDIENGSNDCKKSDERKSPSISNDK